MRDLIIQIVKPIVDHPEDIRVEMVEESHQITYNLSVHQEDIGKVIGKKGRVAKAIRTVVYSCAGVQQHKRIYLDIVD
ncbi:KH domain-containing protein [Heyndrickxia camelliae]|uniref:RNA-binding protein KhpA n=1 Tax=Heyndrickxia camelliae TaxID=1707093 RepID=A0A2N3LR64_9BACI|nr:KH domain-containing protein [Heyndrickxia camelliae]PKR87033.1 hypothetical protein CWO92_02970 [Heyndrickxia camelliae]